MPGFLPNASDPSTLMPNPSSPQVPGAFGTLGGQATGLASAVGINTSAPGMNTNQQDSITTGAPQLPEAQLMAPFLSPLQQINNTYTFVNWPAMATTDLLDYRNLYPYEFVILKHDPVNSSYQPVMNIFMQLPPTTISVNIPNAVSLSVTQNGILEENNAAPLRNISMSGTTGVINSDMAATSKASGVASVLDYAFKNTISAASTILQSATTAVQSVQRVAGSVFGGNTQLGYPVNTAIDAANNTVLLRRTGYYAFHDMARFFEAYMGLKKTAEGRYYRLVFNMHKDRMYFGCTLNTFNWQKLPGTVEYNYSIALTAWRMFSTPPGSSTKAKALSLPSPATDPLALVKNTLNSLTNAVKTIRNAGSILLRGVLSDYANIQQNLFEPTRQLVLSLKNASSTDLTASDMPANVLQEGSTAVYAAIQASITSDSALASAVDAAGLQTGLFGNPKASGTPGAAGQSAISDTVNEQSHNTLSPGTTPPVTSSPAQQIFNDPVRYASVFDQINLSSVQFSQAVNQHIQDEIDTANNLSLQQLQKMQASVMTYSRLYAESVGAGDATYNRINGVAPPTNLVNTLTIKDIEMLAALNDIVLAFNNVIALMGSINVTPANDYFKYYVSYAINNGLALQDAQSKFLVPFPSGANLEMLALQYLQDLDRWPEIAAINGLKEPYVDEDGYFIPLIGDGAENTVLIQSPQKLFVGAVVFIQSDNHVPLKFKIAQIKVLDANNTLIIFQDDDDLSAYTINENAKIHAYLPDTVNSMKLIAIPSQGAPNTNTRIQIGPGVSDLAGLSQVSKTDFLLNSEGDWVFTPGGNIVTATGYTNLVQAANIKLLTPLGSMLNHYNFGNPAQSGANVADLNASKILQLLNALFASDPRFTGVLAGQVVLKGPAMPINLLVGIAGTNVNMPITTVVPAG